MREVGVSEARPVVQFDGLEYGDDIRSPRGVFFKAILETLFAGFIVRLALEMKLIEGADLLVRPIGNLPYPAPEVRIAIPSGGVGKAVV